MQSSKNFFLIISLCLTAHNGDADYLITPSCASSIRQDGGAHQLKVPDGFYLILNEWADTTGIGPVEGAVIRFSHDFLDDNTKGQPLFLEVMTSEYVPLILSRKPESVEQKDRRINLLLTMTPGAGRELERFTGKYTGRKTCIVVGGVAVTKHKIREKITGGRLQISRCTDNACKYLLPELEDNLAR